MKEDSGKQTIVSLAWVSEGVLHILALDDTLDIACICVTGHVWHHSPIFMT